MTERTRWAAMLAAALRLGVAPHRFWRLSLREWRAIAATHDVAMNAADLQALAARFPDRTHD